MGSNFIEQKHYVEKINTRERERERERERAISFNFQLYFL